MASGSCMPVAGPPRPGPSWCSPRSSRFGAIPPATCCCAPPCSRPRAGRWRTWRWRCRRGLACWWGWPIRSPVPSGQLSTTPWPWWRPAAGGWWAASGCCPATTCSMSAATSAPPRRRRCWSWAATAAPGGWASRSARTSGWRRSCRAIAWRGPIRSPICRRNAWICCSTSRLLPSARARPPCAAAWRRGPPPGWGCRWCT